MSALNTKPPVARMTPPRAHQPERAEASLQARRQALERRSRTAVDHAEIARDDADHGVGGRGDRASGQVADLDADDAAGTVDDQALHARTPADRRHVFGG